MAFSATEYIFITNMPVYMKYWMSLQLSLIFQWLVQIVLHVKVLLAWSLSLTPPLMFRLLFSKPQAILISQYLSGAVHDHKGQ